MKRAEWVWPLVLVGLLGVGYGLVPLPDATDPADSFSEGAGGKKAFYLLASELLEDVDRGIESLVPGDPDADVLLLIGPARYPDRAQWQTLHDWVSQGRALVFAARWQDPAVELEPFGIRVVPEMNLFGLQEEDDEARGTSEEPSEERPASGSSSVTTHLVDGGAVDWRSSGRVESSSPDASVELARDGAPQVVWQPVGDGVIVVTASDHVFSNRSLATGENGLLAFRILESASPAGPVIFDETMNRAGAPQVVGVLFEHPFRLPTIQLLLVALLFAWMSSRRFGPTATSEIPARRSLVEHASALGSLHFKVGSGPSLVAAYLEFFRRELGLRLGRDAAGGLVEAPQGPHADRPPPIARALRAAKSPSLDRARAAELIVALARHRTSSRRDPRASEKESS